jgi:hypothetical protein
MITQTQFDAAIAIIQEALKDKQVYVKFLEESEKLTNRIVLNKIEITHSEVIPRSRFVAPVNRRLLIVTKEDTLSEKLTRLEELKKSLEEKLETYTEHLQGVERDLATTIVEMENSVEAASVTKTLTKG